MEKMDSKLSQQEIVNEIFGIVGRTNAYAVRRDNLREMLDQDGLSDEEIQTLYERYENFFELQEQEMEKLRSLVESIIPKQ